MFTEVETREITKMKSMVGQETNIVELQGLLNKQRKAEEKKLATKSVVSYKHTLNYEHPYTATQAMSGQWSLCTQEGHRCTLSR